MTSQLAKKILVVEDDRAIGDLIVFHLKHAHYDVTAVGDGRKGQELISTHQYDLLILDVRLPGLDGLALCRSVRSQGTHVGVPILMLTARREESDKVAGLQSGADDYLTKPFGIREFLARVEALLRRSTASWGAARPRERTAVSALDVVVDPQRHRVECDGEPVTLTPQEFNLLYLLVSHPGVVFEREELLERIRDGDPTITNRGVDVLVRRLRLKIEKDPRNPQRIVTVWGSGYKFG
jgi:two-component system, OmpR family, response regulator